MNAAAATRRGGSERQRQLRALGVVPYVLRRGRDAPAVDRIASPVATGLPSAPRCVLVLPRAGKADGRQHAQVRALLASVGLLESGFLYIASDDGDALAGMPETTAYLALGHAAARALGEALPTAWREAATMVVTETEPADWLRQPGSRRGAWHALKPLRQALRGSD